MVPMKQNEEQIDSVPAEPNYVEEAKKAWREEHYARIEAEEAKAAVIKSAEAAIEEANELKRKLAKELEEAQLRTKQALQAKELYEEARAQTEEVKKIWKEACTVLLACRPDDRLTLGVQEAKEMAEYSLKWQE
jgi:hypothetical protein